MTPLQGWLLFVALLVLYGLAVYGLYRAGRIGPDRSLSLLGPALMMKTRRGRGLLERLGRFRRFWSVLGSIGVGLAGIAMVLIVGLLALDAYAVTQISPSAAPSPQEALGIPGINPIIPIGYGLVALAIGIVLHELAHGVMARSQGIGVKTLGILWFIVPIGAFVEQDDEQMNAAPRRQRRRVAAAGVLANFILTVVFFLVLAATLSGSIAPNANGVGVAYVVTGSPAANASLVPGDIITAINATPTPTNAALLDALAADKPGAVVAVTFYNASSGALETRSITLAARGEYVTDDPTHADEGFLGVSPLFLTPAGLKSDLVFPPTSPSGTIIGGIDWLVLPLAGIEPIAGPTAGFFHVTGPLAGLGAGNFWILANLLYWLAWMNLLLGLSNTLPLIPLDGGLLFRDFIAGIAARVRPRWDAARLDGFSGSATIASSVIVVFLLVWQFVGPHL
ncbi:MAG: site-2 protease family protein [Thermoplasmata archaeon]|nr:site-2 protease family protein [Thermoplasmata archaeon]